MFPFKKLQINPVKMFHSKYKQNGLIKKKITSQNNCEQVSGLKGE